MRIIGLTNPILIFVGLFPLYLFYNFIQQMGQNLFCTGLDSYFILVFLLAILVVGPVLLLMSLRIIVIQKNRIKEIYIFRLKVKTYQKSELVSTFTQKMIGNSVLPFDFYQTYLYFGQDRGIRFSAIEFLNYKPLRRKFEEIEKNTANKI